MLSATDEEGQPMSDEDLRDQVLTFLFAGHETTASALSWAFYWIYKLPKVKEKLLQEIDILGDNFLESPYLKAVCQEVLRIYPISLISIPRMAKSTVEIMDRQFEAGTVLVASIYSLHHREDLYPEAKQFKPERFLSCNYSAYEFIAFGGGNRRCLGYALAILEMKLVIGTILSNYNLALADNKVIKPQRRGMTIAPSNGVPLVMTGKRTAKRAVGLS
ncbi:MAG: cytochrome P450 [Cyanobacteria bacterium P01_A01_bin.84]